MAKATEVRLGIIGCGGMGSHHMTYFSKISRLKFVGVTDVDDAAAEKAVQKYSVKKYPDAEAMLDSGEVNAVLIATPHYFHPPYAIAAMQRGIHVLTEKPVAVTAKAAAEMNAAHAKHPKTVFAVMFQMRTVPVFRRLKQMIDGGELGALKRVSWTITSWFRSQAYYDSGTWRATWAGEGGGVLLNQCPHNLDIFTWLFGSPSRVIAQVKLGKYHTIEVEDDVNAYFEFSNGVTGNFVTSTGEAPGLDQLEISAERGRVLISHNSNKIEFVRNQVEVTEFCRTTKGMWDYPPSDKITMEVGGQAPQHEGITRNFVEAILDGAKLIAPGEDGIKGLEFGNAILMSGLTNKPVDIPTDREAFDKLIQDLAKKSKFKKPEPAKPKAVDMAASFH